MCHTCLHQDRFLHCQGVEIHQKSKAGVIALCAVALLENPSRGQQLFVIARAP